MIAYAPLFATCLLYVVKLADHWQEQDDQYTDGDPQQEEEAMGRQSSCDWAWPDGEHVLTCSWFSKCSVASCCSLLVSLDQARLSIYQSTLVLHLSRAYAWPSVGSLLSFRTQRWHNCRVLHQMQKHWGCSCILWSCSRWGRHLCRTQLGSRTRFSWVDSAELRCLPPSREALDLPGSLSRHHAP